MSKAYRKAINFDLFTKQLKLYYPNPKNLPDWVNRLKAYHEIGTFLKQNGFVHRQWSGYISKTKLNKADIDILMSGLTEKFDWLKYCINKMDVTNIGMSFSYAEMLKGNAPSGLAIEGKTHEEIMKRVKENNQANQIISKEENKNKINIKHHFFDKEDMGER